MRWRSGCIFLVRCAVAFPNFYQRQKADYDADTGQLYVEVAYPT